MVRKAEIRDEKPAAVGDEILSAFKVGSFNCCWDEDYIVPKHESSPEDAKECEDYIIPDDESNKVDEEERRNEMKDLYLPPCSTKSNTQVGSDDDKRKKKRRRDAIDSERPRNIGRPHTVQRDTVKGFVDYEARRNCV